MNKRREMRIARFWGSSASAHGFMVSNHVPVSRDGRDPTGKAGLGQDTFPRGWGGEV